MSEITRVKCDKHKFTQEFAGKPHEVEHLFNCPICYVVNHCYRNIGGGISDENDLPSRKKDKVSEVKSEERSD